MSAQSLVEQVRTVSTRRKRRYRDAFDENSTMTKRLKISGGVMGQTLSETKATTNIDNEESRTSEKTSSASLPEGVSEHVDCVCF